MVVYLILYVYLEISLNPSLMSATDLPMLITGFAIVLAFLIFWFPLRRANRILVLEKRRLLREVNLRIETTFGLLHTGIDKKEFGNIAEIREVLQSLMIEKEFVQTIRTWPWNPGTFRGLLTLILAPLILDLFVMILSKFITFW
jgi:hypothetical protein